jgi:nucleoside-diphosphate-sugar epimerase
VRVLVIGGSGLLGHQLVPALVSAGHCVTVLTRGQAPLPTREVTHIVGDRRDRGSLIRLTGDFDAVVDNVAYTPDDAESLLTALAGRIGHYCVTSTAFVYAGINDAITRPARPFREDDPVGDPHVERARDAHDRYVRDKRRLEARVREMAAAQGLPVTIMRPLLQIVGPHTTDGRFAWFWLRVRDGGPVWLPDDARWKAGPCQLAYSGDVAQAMVAALARPPRGVAVYNLGQPELWTYEEYLREMARVAGRDPRDLDIRYAPRPVLDRAPFAAAGQYRIPLPYPVAFDVHRSLSDLGVTPTPMPRWMEATAAWMDAHYGTAPTPPWYAARAAEWTARLGPDGSWR